MDVPSGAAVVGQHGLAGTILPRSSAVGRDDVEVLLDDGRHVNVPAALLEPQADGRYRLPLGPEDFDPRRTDPDHPAVPVRLAAVDASPALSSGGRVIDERDRSNDPDHVVVPLVEERVEFATRTVETGRVRVATHVVESTETVDPALIHEDVEVERVRVDRLVGAPEQPRREGDTIIVPLMEEVLVVTKQWVVREEIRLTTRQTQVHDPQQVKVRRTEATIERLEPRSASARGADDAQRLPGSEPDAGVPSGKSGNPG